jgi:hypothetical protein
MVAVAILAVALGCLIQFARWGRLSRDYRQRANGLGAREFVCRRNQENLLAEAQVLSSGGDAALALVRSKFRRYAYGKDDRAIAASLRDLSALVEDQSGIYARAADHFAGIKMKYDRAAHRPWEGVPAVDPPDPDTMAARLFEDWLTSRTR